MSERYGFEIGTEVAIFSDDGWHRNGRVEIKRIAKYHKNGNFVVEGSSQQWRPSTGNYAIRTGSSFYRSSCRLLTPEVRAQAEKSMRMYQWRRAVDVIEKIKAETVTDEMLAAIKVVLAMKRENVEA